MIRYVMAKWLDRVTIGAVFYLFIRLLKGRANLAVQERIRGKL